MPGIETERIELGSLQRSSLVVCLLQLASPFDGELLDTRDIHRRLAWPTPNADQRVDKIHRVLTAVGDEFLERPVDLVVLPEYVLPMSGVDVIASFSQRYGTTAIVNYYDTLSRASVTAVITPEGRRFEQPKLIPSPLDSDVLGPIEQKVLKRFYWIVDPGGAAREMTLQVLTCSDYLNLGKEYVDTAIPGLVVVPMCTPKLEEFEGVSSLIKRDKTKSAGELGSTVIVLANAVSASETNNAACGQSRLVCLGEDDVCLPKDREGGLVASVDCLQEAARPARFGRPNRAITSLVTFEFSDDGALALRTPQFEFRGKYCLHPNALMKLGLCNYYMFFRTPSYWETRKLLKRADASCWGIYGEHDVMVQSFEEDYDFGAQRLKVTHQDAPGSVSGNEYMQITRCIKYRGEMVAEWKPADGLRKYLPLSIANGDRFVEENRKEIRAALLGQPVAASILEKLVAKRVLLEGLGPSDVRPRERQMGKREYWILVRVAPARTGNKVDSFSRFEERVLHDAGLCEDERVRTIEVSEWAGGGAGREIAHYILHAVGTLDDMTELVVHGIHSKTPDDAVFETVLVPFVEDLGSGSFAAIDETRTTDGSQYRESMKTIIRANLELQDPFVVKRLQRETMDLAVEIFEGVERSRDCFWPDPSVFKPLTGDVARLLHFAAAILDAPGDAIRHKDLQLLSDHGRNAVVGICTKCETVLSRALQIVEAKADSRNGEGFTKSVLEDAWTRSQRKSRSPIAFEWPPKSMRSSVLCLCHWAAASKKIASKCDPIFSALFYECAENLNKSRADEFRNKFAHGDGHEGRVLKGIEKKTDVIRLLEAVRCCTRLLVDHGASVMGGEVDEAG